MSKLVMGAFLGGLAFCSPYSITAQPTPPPAVSVSSFYLACVSTGGSPGEIFTGNSATSINLIVHGGGDVNFTFFVAPRMNSQPQPSIAVGFTQEGNSTLNRHVLSDGQSYSHRGNSFRILSAQAPTQSYRLEYCFVKNHFY